MEKISLSEGLMAQMMENEAWVHISKEHPFSLDQLEKYADRIDWEELSCNGDVYWTIPMLEKFKSRLNWSQIARNMSEEKVSVEMLEKFKDIWDWDEYSDYGSFTEEIVERFADRLNWRKLINNYSLHKSDVEAFFRKYEDRIPVSDFKDSRLWDELVEKKGIELRRRMLLG